MERFKNFIIKEERSFLGNNIGNVLSGMQSLQNDIENMGSRQVSRVSETIVNEIRKILHKNWNPKYHNQLKELQKVAVAIQKTIDERGDLKQILPAALESLSVLSGKLGVKINNLSAPEPQTQADISPEEFQSTGQQPDFSRKQQSAQQEPAQQGPAQQGPAQQAPNMATDNMGMDMAGPQGLGMNMQMPLAGPVTPSA